jgi:hypothetical protein
MGKSQVVDSLESNGAHSYEAGNSREIWVVIPEWSGLSGGK